MNIKQMILLFLFLIILVLMGTMPLWWDDWSPYILRLPGYIMAEINAYLNAIKWLLHQILG